MRLPLVCGLVLGTLLAACTTSRPYVASDYRAWQDTALPPVTEQTYQVFLLGEAGHAPPSAPLLRLLRTQLGEAGENSAVLFLGDNAYPGGFPDSAAADRAAAEQRLTKLIDTVRDHEGRVLFIPGNHDWTQGGLDGRAALARQESFLEAAFDKNVFRPDDGFPGPEEIKLTDDLRLLVLDTQWWLHPHDKSYGDAGDYDIDEDADFFLQLDDIIKKNRRRHLLVVGHHALFSNGRHNGYFPTRTHLFPLTHIAPDAYLPLPLLGSIYPLYVRYVGGRQNLVHARYQALREGLRARFHAHTDLVYASAHDHSLQYFRKDDQHYLVSGALTHPQPVSRGRGAVFAAETLGYQILHYYRDGSIWLEAWTLDDDGAGRVLFRTELAGPAADRVDAEAAPPDDEALPDYRDSTRVVVANADLAAGTMKQFFWGAQRRDAWTTPIEVPYLDLGREAGGLTPIKRGGGLQSTSLRLQGADGHEYVLRSAKKDPSKSLPEDLRKTFAGAISRDQAASQHPYGAYIIPPLADAAGVYHANPKPVYVPKDPRLGVYEDAIGGQLMLFEERPNDDMSHAPHFGRSEDVVGAPKMYREVTNDNDHRVDGRALARARLFDMLLSDWDRHIDQWRWASFKVEDEAGKHTIYRPIPRDRDVAFNRLNGLLPGLTKPFTKYQDFRITYGNLRGLTLNAWEQDHRFLAALKRSDWIEIADSIRLALSDEVFANAMQLWPLPIHAHYSEEFLPIFTARREKLLETAEAFYELHAHSVDVVGSNKHERFEVRRLNDDETEVVMYKIKKDGEIRRELYRRLFRRAETKEIFLYGLDGNDRFEITGAADKGITIIAVGGAGEDSFTDHSVVGGWSRKTRFYDTASGNRWSPGSETRLFRTDHPDVNYYDHAIRYDTLAPAFVFSSDRDDGTLLGAGIKVIRHALRKKPYAAAHLLTASYALGTEAFTAAYDGHYVADLDGWDVLARVRWQDANNTHNFFGFGNETPYDEDRDEDFNQARLSQLTLAPGMRKHFRALTLEVGASLEITNVQNDTNRFIGQQPDDVIAARTFEDQWYAGLDAVVTLGETDRPLNPRQGILWTSTAMLNLGVRDAEGTFGTLQSELTTYLSPSITPQVTLAARVGIAHTAGDFPFYYANTLGGSYNLRGYRNERFSGRTSLYQNIELRLGLLDFTTYLALGEGGVLGFLDNGRVWYDKDDSDLWHQGYGGGLWFNLFDAAVLTGTVGFSEDDTFFKIEMGFFF